MMKFDLRMFKRLKHDQSGLAMVEFAVSLPFFMTLTIGGFETANFAYTVMKLNQLTINVADGASRIGSGDDALAARRVTERDINDIFAGAIREGRSILLEGQASYTDPGTGAVELRGNALVVLSSVETVESFNPSAQRFRIRWQRCLGKPVLYQSSYGNPITAVSIENIGPAGQTIRPLDGNAVMFVETQYLFKPTILNGFSKLTERKISQTAAMIVRDRRDYVGGVNGVHPAAGSTASMCDAGT
jgi:hypothetical protein